MGAFIPLTSKLWPLLIVHNCFVYPFCCCLLYVTPSLV